MNSEVVKRTVNKIYNIGGVQCAILKADDSSGGKRRETDILAIVIVLKGGADDSGILDARCSIDDIAGIDSGSAVGDDNEVSPCAGVDRITLAKQNNIITVTAEK